MSWNRFTDVIQFTAAPAKQRRFAARSPGPAQVLRNDVRRNTTQAAWLRAQDASERVLAPTFVKSVTTYLAFNFARF